VTGDEMKSDPRVLAAMIVGNREGGGKEVLIRLLD
jgi:hypothetical protein